MNFVEIIAVGRELLSGRTLDTNSNWIAKRITALGGEVRRIVVVDDQMKAIIPEIRKALRKKGNIIITTGGLGPTFDDRTLEAVAKAVKRDLVLNQKALAFVKGRYRFFKEQGAVEDDRMTPHRKKMAILPKGAIMLYNSVGAAPGMRLTVKGRWIYSLPGVPKEMKSIFEETMLEEFKKIFGRRFILEERIATPLNDESKLGEIVDRLMKEVPGAYLKSKPTTFGNKVKLDVSITASGDDEEELRKRIEQVKERMRSFIDTFDGAKPRFLNRGKKRRSVSTLSIPRASDRGVEWVDFEDIHL